jgi:hypothetical protein
MKRQCGDCQLCCRLLPVPPLGKKAGQRCQYQKFGKGCAVYHTAKMPPGCRLWNCRWLVNDDADELSRPDRSHYVIDVMPDFITWQNNETGEQQNVQVVQIWVDRKYPDAHRDPALRKWIFRRAQDGIAALIRFNARDALTVFAPPFDERGEWHEVPGVAGVGTHTLTDTVQALGGDGARMVIEP